MAPFGTIYSYQPSPRVMKVNKPWSMPLNPELTPILGPGCGQPEWPGDSGSGIRHGQDQSHPGLPVQVPLR